MVALTTSRAACKLGRKAEILVAALAALALLVPNPLGNSLGSIGASALPTANHHGDPDHRSAVVRVPSTPASGGPLAAALPGSWLSTLSVSIGLPGNGIDPNATFTVTALVGGAIGPVRCAWADSLGATASGSTATFVAPSSGTIGLGVRVTDGFGDTASANATISVGTAPSISMGADVAATDVGRPVPITLRIQGSFPPFSILWQPLPAGLAGSSSLPGPGEIEVAAVGSAPGYEWVRATVSDRYGASATVQAVVAVVHDPPRLFLAAARSEVEAGAEAYVSGLISGGTPPFSWAAATSLPATNVSGSTGVANASEPVSWSGRFRSDGVAMIRFEVTDAAGYPITANGTIRVLPSLAPTLVIETADPAVSAPLNVSADLLGGVPPYAYTLSLSDGELLQSAAPSEGPVAWTAHPSVPGYLVLRLVVSDALSATEIDAVTVLVGPSGARPVSPVLPPSNSNNGHAVGSGSPSGSSSGAWALAISGGAGLGCLLGIGTILFLRKRRSASRDPNASDRRADEVVRRLVEGPEGTEHSVLTLLAQEEGVGPEELDRVLQRLEAAGRVRREPGPDGGSLVRWVGNAPDLPTAPAPEGTVGR